MNLKRYCIKATLSQGSVTIPDMIVQIIFVDDDTIRARVGLRFWANEASYDNKEIPLTKDALYVLKDDEYRDYLAYDKTELINKNEFYQIREWLLNRTPRQGEKDLRGGVLLDKFIEYIPPSPPEDE